MAKRSFPPMLCFFLALLLRAEMIAGAETRPAPSNEAALEPIADTNVTFRAPRQPVADPRRTSKINPSVEYALSDNSYRDDPNSGRATAPQRNVRRAPQRHATLSRVQGYRPSATESESRPASDLVQYEDERFGEIDARDVEEDTGGYSAEMYEEEYAGEDGYEYEEHPGMFAWWHRPWFRTSHNSPPHIGLGEPLQGTSWLNRPSSISFFAGVLNGDELIADRVDQGSALFGGLRLGWDFDHYWGLEARAGWSSPAIEYDPAPPPKRVDGIFLCDVSVLYYPWGDAAWRPYGLLGMGMAGFDFTDEIGEVHNPFLLGIPIGFGLKYQYHPNLAFRAEFLDNIACGGSELDTMQNLSFSLGMELRFGGKPRSYYPWQPAKYIW